MSSHSHQGTHSAVLDTQSVLDWLLFEDPRSALWESWRQAGHWRWVGTMAMREELAHVLQRGHIRQATPVATERLWAALDARLTLASAPPPQPSADSLRCRDPDDQKFIDFARDSGARWLVSRDKAVLRLRARAARLHGLVIVSPFDWMPQAESR